MFQEEATEDADRDLADENRSYVRAMKRKRVHVRMVESTEKTATVTTNLRGRMSRVGIVRFGWNCINVSRGRSLPRTFAVGRRQDA